MPESSEREFFLGDWVDTSPATLRASVGVVAIAIAGWVVVWNYFDKEEPPPAAVLNQLIEDEVQEQLTGHYKVTIGKAADTHGLAARWFYLDMAEGGGAQAFSLFAWRPGLELKSRSSRIDRAGNLQLEIERLASESAPDPKQVRDPLAGPQDTGAEAVWSREVWTLTGRPLPATEVDPDGIDDPLPAGFSGSAVVLRADGGTSRFSFRAVRDDSEKEKAQEAWQQHQHQDEVKRLEQESGSGRKLTPQEMLELRTAAPPSAAELKELKKATAAERARIRAEAKKNRRKKKQDP